MPWRAAADSGSEAVGRFKAGRFRNGGMFIHCLINKLSRMLLMYFVLKQYIFIF